MVKGFASGRRDQSSSMAAGGFQSSDRGRALRPERQKMDLPSNVPRGTSPLGLKFTTTPSFMELIETKLDQESTDWEKMIKYKTQPEAEKLKASNFPALSLQIGSWKREASNDSDIVVKCYFAKKKLVWEILYEGLKRKMEIPWQSMSAIRATFPEGQPSSLEIELKQPPKYFCEINPQPRRHTTWENFGDFTGGQAEIYKHLLTFPEGTLEKHYEKLVHCDSKLFLLNRMPFPTLNSPFFFMVPNELRGLSCDLRSEHPYLYNQPPVNMFKPQQLPLQIPLVRNLGTIGTPTRRIVADQSTGPSINSSYSLPLQRPTMGDMGMNSLSPAMSFSHINEDLPIPMVRDPMTSHSVNNFQPIKVSAATYPGLHENIPLWDQGVQYISDSVGAKESQSQERPLSTCATPAHNIHPRRTGLSGGINSIARRLFGEAQAPIYAQGHALLSQVAPTGLGLNEVAQVAPTQGCFDRRNHREYTFGDPNSLMAPIGYNQNKAQVVAPPDGFNWGNDGGHNLCDPNSLMAPRNYDQTEGPVAPLPLEGFDLMIDGGYDLWDPGSSMAPRDYNQGEGQVALLPEGFMPMNDGKNPSVGMEESDQETVTKGDGNPELLFHPFLH